MASFMLQRSASSAVSAAARSFSTTAARDLARITIVGKVCSTPTSSTTNSGRGLVKYSVASQQSAGDNKPLSQFRITCFADGPRRETILNLARGTMVYIEGDATVSQFLDNDGRRQSSLGIVQRSMSVIKPNDVKLAKDGDES
ncbi:hypothetical protein XA68_10657 [Ophiocordyceps unilateralis]|uniref:OB domain-containing protein n=1 Tax=Ophiocordyceps unilateralis TaxID=268505 RepID=A0A2A9PHV1_OPHUN|nr:hypothetical protein XA68_10657 [Ophiocordyceps unilateralis]